jgi:hypothetical protein
MRDEADIPLSPTPATMEAVAVEVVVEAVLLKAMKSPASLKLPCEVVDPAFY